MKHTLLLPAIALAVLSACAPTPSAVPKVDPTSEAWYAPTVQRLAQIDVDAATLAAAGRLQEAAVLVTSGQALQTRLLSAPRPTLEAMQAIADLDQVYGHMLIANGFYGEARMLFQKNVTRWKVWKPQTPDTQNRLKLANAGIAECDKHMGG